MCGGERECGERERVCVGGERDGCGGESEWGRRERECVGERGEILGERV